MSQPALGAGNVTGRVFQDHNASGVRETAATLANAGAGSVGTAVDQGVGAVTVRAYDAAGTLQGTAATLADGTYSLTAAGTGPYRVEFDATSFPTGFRSGPHGADSGTSIQYVADGTAANVNLGVNRPSDYCQDNPTLVTSCYVFGNQTGPTAGGSDNSALPTLVSFPYAAGSNDATPANYALPTHPTLALANQIGTTWGLAYSRRAKRIFAASYFKRHTGFGPGGPGAIYVVNPATQAVTATFIAPGQQPTPTTRPTSNVTTATLVGRPSARPRLVASPSPRTTPRSTQ